MSAVKILVLSVVFFLANCKRGANGDPLHDVRIRRSPPNPPWNETDLDTLRNDLLTNYDKYARPGQHYDVTTVGIGISITHIEVDELNSTVSVSSWLKLYWSDPKLKWDKADYGGVDSVKMADHEVWQPDIYLYNSASSGGEAVARYGNPNAIVYSDGHVLWMPPVKFTALCEFNLHYWPFDTQHCYLRFASWTRSARELKLELFGNQPVDFEPSLAIMAWEVNVTGEVVSDFRVCCPDTFYNAHFNLTLTRKWSSYVAVVTTPAIVIVCLVLMQSWLPSQERIILSCFTIVTISMLLIYFTQKISAMGINPAWIVSYYSTSLYIACFSLIETIFILLLLKSQQKQTLPWNIKKLLKGKLGKCLLLDHNLSECNCAARQPAEEMKDYQQSEFEDKGDEQDVIIKYTPERRIEQEWEILGLAIDRIFFIIYSCVYLVLFLLYLI